MTTLYEQTLKILRDEIGRAPKYNDLRKDGSRRLQWPHRVLKFDEIHGLTEYLKSEGLSGVGLKTIRNKRNVSSIVAEIPENIVSERAVKLSECKVVKESNVLKSLKYAVAATLAVTLTLVLLPLAYLASLVTNKVIVSGTKIYVRNKYGATVFGVGFGF